MAAGLLGEVGVGGGCAHVVGVLVGRGRGTDVILACTHCAAFMAETEGDDDDDGSGDDPLLLLPLASCSLLL